MLSLRKCSNSAESICPTVESLHLSQMFLHALHQSGNHLGDAGHHRTGMSAAGKVKLNVQVVDRILVLFSYLVVTRKNPRGIVLANVEFTKWP